MSRATVRDYIKQILTDGTTGILIEPSFPKAEGITDIVFIQAITSDENRSTMPRGGGRKDIAYKLTMIAMTSNDDEALVPQQMDAILEQVFGVLRSTDLNVILADTIANQTSQITKIGENIRVVTDAVFQLQSTQGNEASVMESVSFTFDLTEQIQA